MEKFMKCSNAWQMGHQLRNRMLDELKLAIKAHGGEYVWYSEEDEEYADNVPIVMCNHRYAGPVDVKVRRVYIDKHECMDIEAATNEYDEDIQIEFDDIVPTHIQYIIECIPATDEVADVSIQSTALPIYKEDYLNVLQEMTSQAIVRMQECCDFPRSECFDLIRTWTNSFICEHRDTDWRETDFYLEIDKFIDCKLVQL